MRTAVPMRYPDTPLVWVIEDVYSAAECLEMIARIESWAPRIATNNPIYRNQDRVMRDEPELASELFARIQKGLPATIGGLRLVGLNERLRFYRYGPGQRFEAHMDHWYQPDETHITLLTVLVYFNADFEGGATRFEEQVTQTVHPHPGRVAVFQHKVRHEGCEVIRGQKYAMRSDVIYEAPSPIVRTLVD